LIINENQKNIIKILNERFIEKEAFNKINVLGDGNCLYRCFAYYFEKNEYKYYNYRNHIYRYAKLNYDKIKDNFEYEIKNGEKIYYIPDEITTHSKIPLLQYIKNIKLNKQFSGDLELSCAFIIYNNIKDILFLEYGNNNHYNILKKI